MVVISLLGSYTVVGDTIKETESGILMGLLTADCHGMKTELLNKILECQDACTDNG